MTYNEIIRDKYLSSTSDVLKLGNTSAASARKIIRDAREEILKELSSISDKSKKAPSLNLKRKQTFLRKANIILSRSYSKIRDNLTKDLEDIVGIESELMNNLLRVEVPIEEQIRKGIPRSSYQKLMGNKIAEWGEFQRVSPIPYATYERSLWEQLRKNSLKSLKGVKLPNSEDIKLLESYKQIYDYQSPMSGYKRRKTLSKDLNLDEIEQQLLKIAPKFRLPEETAMYSVVSKSSLTKIGKKTLIDAGSNKFNVMSADISLIEYKLNRLYQAGTLGDYTVIRHLLPKGAVAVPVSGFASSAGGAPEVFQWLIPNEGDYSSTGRLYNRNVWVADPSYPVKPVTKQRVRVLGVSRPSPTLIDNLKDASIAVNLDITNPTLPPSFIKNIINTTIIDGHPASAWIKRQLNITQKRFRSEVQKGLLQGDSLGGLIRRIRGRSTGKRTPYLDNRGKRRYFTEFKGGVFDLSTRQADALVRTSIQSVMQKSRETLYMQNSDIIKGVQILATLDGATTLFCRSHDGLAWTLDGTIIGNHNKLYPGYSPYHWACRTINIAILRSWSELMGPNSKLSNAKRSKLADADITSTTRASMDGQVPSKITYDEWFLGKSETEQIKVIGKKRLGLLKSGAITTRDLTTDRGNFISVDELMDRYGTPSSFDEILDSKDRDLLGEFGYDTTKKFDSLSSSTRRLSDKENAAILAYMRDPYINDRLRQFYINEGSLKSSGLNRDHLDQIGILDNLMQPLGEDSYLYRGTIVPNSWIGKDGFNLEKVLPVDPGYASASLHSTPSLSLLAGRTSFDLKNMAKNNKSIDGVPIVFKIRAKKGQKALPLGRTYRRLTKSNKYEHDFYSSEKEVLLPRNSKFKVRETIPLYNLLRSKKYWDSAEETFLDTMLLSRDHRIVYEAYASQLKRLGLNDIKNRKSPLFVIVDIVE